MPASVHQEQLVRTLPILVIHAHGSCNCRCVMCDIWKTRENKTFSVRDLERQLDSIRRLEVRWIVFSGGEPLMNPELPKICEILRREGIRLTLLSTGLLLKKHSDEVAGSFDEVIVSLDGPRAIHDKIRRVEGAFDLLQSGILALRQVRPDIRITARSTVQKMNHRYLVETARAAEQMQLDGISFLAVDVSSPAFNRSLVWPTELQAEVALSIQGLSALETAIEELIYCAENEFRAGFVAESPQKLRRILRHFSAELGLEPWESPTCNAPWVSSVLEVDGTVRPCFFHPAIGNLQNSTLEKVINSQTALDFRSNLDIPSNSVCQKCVCSLNYRR
jgi:Fe-coproporphyrin III synthase